jgi:hypothetical protein
MSSNPISAILYVFKLLTPKVIMGLTKATSLRNKSAPILGLGIVEMELEVAEQKEPAASADLAENVGKAKILPLHKSKPSKIISDKQEYVASDYRPMTLGSSALALSREESVLEEIGVHSRRTIEEMQKQQEEAERSMKPTAAEFVISEREKNRDTNRKISESNALGSYQKQCKLKPNTVGKSDIGVLLDKKRF